MNQTLLVCSSFCSCSRFLSFMAVSKIIAEYIVMIITTTVVMLMLTSGTHRLMLNTKPRFGTVKFRITCPFTTIPFVNFRQKMVEKSIFIYNYYALSYLRIEVCLVSSSSNSSTSTIDLPGTSTSTITHKLKRKIKDQCRWQHLMPRKSGMISFLCCYVWEPKGKMTHNINTNYQEHLVPLTTQCTKSECWYRKLKTVADWIWFLNGLPSAENLLKIDENWVKKKIVDTK